MTLGDVLDAVRELAVDAAISDSSGRAVSAIAYDSRRVTAGAVFVALKGLKADGVAFAEQAVARGAQAVVSEAPRPGGVPVPWIVVRDARLALALLADRFFDHPSRRMPVVGVTGTNGKTTTAYLLASMLDAAGLKAGMLGTVAYRIGGEEREASRTTPEAPDVQQLLNEMMQHGCKSAVMEVSSHALSLKRVDGMRFAAAVFTNLTRDHLDFHEDMEAYFAAKRRLFEMLPRDAPGVINLDDPRGPALVGDHRAAGHLRDHRAGRRAPGPLEMTLGGLAFEITTPRGPVRVTSKLVGRPNVYNILAAAATAMSLDVPLDAIERGVAGLAGRAGPLRGRVEAGRRSDGGRRLRAHRRRAAQPARDGAAARRQAADHGVRLRRRSRSHQAPADGHGRGAPQRRRRDHVRQPAQRRSGANHRGDRARHSRRQPVGEPRAVGGLGRGSRRSDRARRCDGRPPATSC